MSDLISAVRSIYTSIVTLISRDVQINQEKKEEEEKEKVFDHDEIWLIGEGIEIER
jgi:hypothetical protein